MGSTQTHGPGIPARLRKEWAKEEVRDVVLRGVAALIEEGSSRGEPLDFDDRTALREQRDRVLRFLGFDPLRVKDGVYR